MTNRMFEEDDEEEEGIPRNSCIEYGDRSPVETTCAIGEAENFTVTPSDRRHCILEDVDGELEMEDASDPKDENTFFMGDSFEVDSKGQGSDMIYEAASNSLTDLASLHESSPPFPLDSPPPTPPLPSSPPPPLPPSYPSPPPPPPPLSSEGHLHPPPEGMSQSLALHPSVTPQPSIASQHLHQFQSLTASPKLAYQPPQPHEYFSPKGTQYAQVAGNNPCGALSDANNRNEMFPQPSSSFAPSAVSISREPSGYSTARILDYSRTDLYTHPQATQANQHFQPGNMHFQQRAFCPGPPPQAPSNHFSYSKVTVQQHPQHPYAPPYLLHTHSDGPKQYVAEEKWRMTSNESSTDTPHVSWMNGVRTSSGSVTSFGLEGMWDFL